MFVQGTRRLQKKQYLTVFGEVHLRCEDRGALILLILKYLTGVEVGGEGAIEIFQLEEAANAKL